MEKPRESGVTRIAGADAETEESILGLFKRHFESKERHPSEREHSPELDELIVGINIQLKEFLQRFGIESLAVPPSNIHCIDRSKLSTDLPLNPAAEGARGVYSPDNQQILIFLDYEENKLKFAHVLAHELLHLNSFQSYQKITGEDYTRTTRENGEVIDRESFSLRYRRVGLRINAPAKNVVYFYDFDEALIEELAIRFDWEHLGSFPPLENQFEERQKSVERNAADSEIDFEIAKRRLLSITVKEIEKGFMAIAEGNSYSKERGKLYELIHDLYEKNRNSFQSEKDVFALFVNAGFTGHLLPLARLVESTYGKGSFRRLGQEQGQPSDDDNPVF